MSRLDELRALQAKHALTREELLAPWDDITKTFTKECYGTASCTGDKARLDVLITQAKKMLAYAIDMRTAIEPRN